MALSFRLDEFFGLRWHKIWRWIKSRCTYYPNDHRTFVVLLADMENDPELVHTKHLANALERMGGFSLVRHGERLTCNDVAKDQFQRRQDLCATAQTWLHRREADILVAGKMYQSTYQLRFFPLVDPDKSDPCPTAYTVQPDFTLDADLVGRLSDVLELTILTHVAPAVKGGRYLVDTLRPLIPKLETYLTDATGIPSRQLWSARLSLALAYKTIGEQAGDDPYLAKAIQTYRLALEICDKNTAPLNWATTQNNLGNALARLGERENGTARLEQAVAAFRLALEVRTQESVPLDWAGTQNNLGTALRSLGERENGTARLEQAVEAFRLALEEWTQERVPLGWAGTQNNLGSALARLGERENGTARLEQAVAAFRLALEVRTQESVPLDWAMTQNNLGTALNILAERENDAEAVKNAIHAYNAAFGVFREAGATYYMKVVRNNLQKAEALLEALGAGAGGGPTTSD